MSQHGTRSSIYCTYMLYMIKSTFNMCGTRQKYGIQYLWSYFAYHGLSLYILVTVLGHTRQLLKKDSMCIG